MLKNIQKTPSIKNKDLNRAILRSFFLILIVMLMSVSIVSAANWDNKKSGLIIDETTSKYGKIEIKNTVFGIPWLQLSKVAELELKKNTDTCGIECSMETTITLFEDGSLIDDVRFMTLQEDGDWIKQGVRSYQFYIKGEDGKKIKVPDYETVCDVTGKKKVKNNKTGEEDLVDETYCYQKEIGSHWIDTPEWIVYNLGDRVSAGTYEIKLEAEKKPTRTVDWQITSQGELIDEWAVWGGRYQEGYYQAILQQQLMKMHLILEM